MPVFRIGENESNLHDGVSTPPGKGFYLCCLVNRDAAAVLLDMFKAKLFMDPLKLMTDEYLMPLWKLNYCVKSCESSDIESFDESHQYDCGKWFDLNLL